MLVYQMKVKLVPHSRPMLVKYLHQQFSQSKEEPQHLPPSNHVYQRIYSWNRLEQFADHLSSKILYSEHDTICLAKPFGVGIHTPYDKSNIPDKIEPKIFGDPRYCLRDALDLLAKKLNWPSCNISHTEDRIINGIVVLSKSSESEKRVKTALKNSKRNHQLTYTFHCLTYGAPIMKVPILEETVAIQEICVNEKTGEKEPEIYYNLSKTQVRKRCEIKRVRVELKVLDYSSSYNVALVEIACSRTNYHFVRCYLANKACFILGDPRFSRRVGHVLGVPFALKASNKKPREEPLSNSVRKILNVPNNKQIPLMIHQSALLLNNYTKNTDVKVENYNYPEHFIWTLNKLFGTNTKYR